MRLLRLLHTVPLRLRSLFRRDLVEQDLEDELRDLRASRSISWDPPTLASAAAVLMVSALLASYIPARRAASVDPIDVLRAE